MARTVRDELLTALEDLQMDSFEKFCKKLRGWKIEEGYTKIPNNCLKDVKPDDVVVLILQFYTASYGPKVTVDVLDVINKTNESLALKEALEKVEGFTWGKKPKEEPPSTSEASSSPAPKPQETHFVDKHEKPLTARVALVAPILDGLKSKGLLRDEQYDTIGAEKTSQEMMRKLYKITREFSESDKDTFYEILKENNGPLIKDLEDS